MRVDGGIAVTEEHRYFTLESANRTLPLVRRIAEDICALYPSLRERVEDFQRVSIDTATEEELATYRARIDEIARQINACLAELDQVGCVFKGFEEGLVDFYSWHDGRPVFLCWKVGEDVITHWHEVDAGFAGRRPVHEGMHTSDSQP